MNNLKVKDKPLSAESIELCEDELEQVSGGRDNLGLFTEAGFSTISCFAGASDEK